MPAQTNMHRQTCNIAHCGTTSQPTTCEMHASPMRPGSTKSSACRTRLTPHSPCAAARPTRRTCPADMQCMPRGTVSQTNSVAPRFAHSTAAARSQSGWAPIRTCRPAVRQERLSVWVTAARRTFRMAYGSLSRRHQVLQTFPSLEREWLHLCASGMTHV